MESVALAIQDGVVVDHKDDGMYIDPSAYRKGFTRRW